MRRVSQVQAHIRPEQAADKVVVPPGGANQVGGDSEGAAAAELPRGRWAGAPVKRLAHRAARALAFHQPRAGGYHGGVQLSSRPR